ncbi:MAG: protein YgfX [Nitrosomonas sp.]
MDELTIHLKSSQQLTLMFSVAHMGCIIIIALLDGSIVLKASGMLLLVLSLIYYIRLYALLQSPNAIVSFYLSDHSTCITQTRSGQQLHWHIQGSSFVTPYLTVLSLKSNQSFFDRSIVIFPDSINAEQFRQLRVWLRWKWKDTNSLE